MKFQYLGTAAAEGWPGVFCRCDACKKAIELKGKNIRTRSQAIVNDDLLLDLPPDTYHHMLVNDINLSAVKYLLITHSHSDHFYPLELALRGGCYAHNMGSEKLIICSNQYVKDDYDVMIKKELSAEIDSNIEWKILNYYDEVQLGEYKVVPLPAKHTRRENDFIYLITKGDKTILYCNDTGIPYDEVFNYFKEHNVHIDFLSFDCTGGPNRWGENAGHMGLLDNADVKTKLIEMGVCDENTIYVINHFSHNGAMLHDELVEEAKKYNMDVSYDSKIVEF